MPRIPRQPMYDNVYTILWGSVTPYEMSATRNPCKHIEAEIRWLIFCIQYFQMHFLDQKLTIYIRMSLKPVKDLSNDTISLVQMMAWHRSDKPLSEPKKVQVNEDICIARSHWLSLNCIMWYLGNNNAVIYPHSILRTWLSVAISQKSLLWHAWGAKK